jgi:hypothetical protein
MINLVANRFSLIPVYGQPHLKHMLRPASILKPPAQALGRKSLTAATSDQLTDRNLEVKQRPD